MLILPRGYEEFNKRREMFDPRDPIKRRDWVNDGNSPTATYRQASAGQNTLMWKIDPNYCPDCGRKDISQENQRNGSHGIFTFDEPHPEVDMKPGDVIQYTRCGECRVESIFEKKNPALVYTHGDWDRARNIAQVRIQNNVLGWIKARRMAGDNPIPWGK